MDLLESGEKNSCISDIAFAARQASRPHCPNARKGHISKLRKLWTSDSNQNQVLPCLCVRTALDLYLRVSAFPEGSEIILSAINIPDMVKIVHHHKLKVVTVDINIDTLDPKSTLMERLVTSKTVAILVAHLYGRWINMDPIIAIAKKYKLRVIEDCAESFCGFSKIGHPDSDLSLFSFGVIKFSTSFGGSIAKVKNSEVFREMSALQSCYPTQTGAAYLKKLSKYLVMYHILQVWPWPQLVQISRNLGKDWKDTFVRFIRGFPDNLIPNMRYQPSTALLSMMAYKHQSFNVVDFDLQRIKAAYLQSKLSSKLRVIGTKAKINNYWLFPVTMENPDLFVKCLADKGVDAYRGATQLNVVEPDDKDCHVGPNLMSGEYVTSHERYPHNARYLVNHVIYMPVNKRVPFDVVDHMAKICNLVADELDASRGHALSLCKSIVKSKL